MNKGGHLFVGIILGAILILATHFYLHWFDFTELTSIGLMILIIYVYSLLADIDTKSGAIVWTFIPIGLIASITGYLIHNNLFLISGIGLIGVTFIAAQFFPHRGFTHSILFGVAASLLWIYISYEYSILAFICFYSHLAADGIWGKFI